LRYGKEEKEEEEEEEEEMMMEIGRKEKCHGQ
jgi:hypothetical protein